MNKHATLNCYRYCFGAWNCRAGLTGAICALEYSREISDIYIQDIVYISQDECDEERKYVIWWKLET